MVQKFDFLQAFIKTATVSGIGFVWVNFTVKAFQNGLSHNLYFARRRRNL